MHDKERLINVASSKKSDNVQNKYDSLVLRTVEKIDDEMDEQTLKLENIHRQTTENTGSIDKIESHLQKQNSRITKVEDKEMKPKESADIGSNKWLIAFLASVILALITAGVLSG